MVCADRACAVGENMTQPWITKAVNWIIHHQNSDGGWGETCESYRNPELAGVGESTASQTGWALLALMAANKTDSAVVLGGSSICLRRRTRMGPGTKTHIPAPVFRSIS